MSNQKLEVSIAAAKKRMYEIGELLSEIKRLDFDELVSERNAISVDLEVMRQRRNGKWTPKYNGPIYSIPNIK